MINLLPPTEKAELLSEQQRKIITILWLLVLFFLVLVSFILLSINFCIENQIESQRTALQDLRKEFEQSEIQDFQKDIDSANLTLTQLNTFYRSKVYLDEILERISGTLPEETYLTNISVVSSGGEKGLKVSLSGFALTREILFEFKKNLEKEHGFKGIYFSPANWVKPADIDFFVTFKIDNK